VKKVGRQMYLIGNFLFVFFLKKKKKRRKEEVSNAYLASLLTQLRREIKGEVFTNGNIMAP
jgi:hypothetical protein